MMRRVSFALTAATALVALGTLTSGPAQAASIGSPDGIRAAVDGLKLTAGVQYYYGGHSYCWDDDGWNGPGWYWCGYEGRSGYGWGGGYGLGGWGRLGRGRRIWLGRRARLARWRWTWRRWWYGRWWGRYGRRRWWWRYGRRRWWWR